MDERKHITAVYLGALLLCLLCHLRNRRETPVPPKDKRAESTPDTDTRAKAEYDAIQAFSASMGDTLLGHDPSTHKGPNDNGLSSLDSLN